MSGDADSDRFYGGAGNDMLNGGDGVDTLIGQGGADELYGDEYDLGTVKTISMVGVRRIAYQRRCRQKNQRRLRSGANSNNAAGGNSKVAAKRQMNITDYKKFQEI